MYQIRGDVKNMKLKKCLNCGALVEIVYDCTCKDGCLRCECCGNDMVELKENTVDCAVEKHKPIYEKVGDVVEVKVNHVMEPEHYIEFIALCSDKINQKVFLQPGELPIVKFPYVKGSKVYAYCNKHGLWSTEVI